MSSGVLVDTSVWSLGLRRGVNNPGYASELKKLIIESRVVLIGPIRQELLSGIASKEQFSNLRLRLGGFPDLPLGVGHFERAAELSDICRSKGIQGSHTDFLICAVAEMESLSIFTTDNDFSLFSGHIKVSMYKIRL